MDFFNWIYWLGPWAHEQVYYTLVMILIIFLEICIQYFNVDCSFIFFYRSLTKVQMAYNDESE